jgi:hypothetical protein
MPWLASLFKFSGVCPRSTRGGRASKPPPPRYFVVCGVRSDTVRLRGAQLLRDKVRGVQLHDPERFGSVVPGHRGGVVAPRMRLTAPLDVE